MKNGERWDCAHQTKLVVLPESIDSELCFVR